MLLMKKIFFEAIRKGTKTTTLRYWQRPQVRAQSNTLIPGLGYVRIEAVRPVSLEELTERDAQADGFATLADLHAALGELYSSDSRTGRTLYHVHFTYLPEGRRCD